MTEKLTPTCHHMAYNNELSMTEIINKYTINALEVIGPWNIYYVMGIERILKVQQITSIVFPSPTTNIVISHR